MSNQPAPGHASELQQPGGYGQQPPMSNKDAKANAAAAKAHSKSQRSFIARHKILTALGVVVLLIIVISVASKTAGGSSGNNAAAGNLSSSGAPAAAAAGLNTPVRDGKFEFTVTAVDPGIATIGTGGVTRTAQGQFILAHVSVKNIGDQAQTLTFNSGAQKLTDKQGRQATASPTARIYVNSQNFLAQINPGNSVQWVVVFDVPKDSVPATFELHDSLFSRGVTVSAK